MASEHTQIHVEAIHLRIRERLLHLTRLLDRRGAADFRTRPAAGFLVTGSDTMHETDPLRIGNPVIRTYTGIDPSLQIGIGNHMVIDAVAVFFLFLRLEQVEAAGYQHSVRENGDTVGKNDIVRLVQPVD